MLLSCWTLTLVGAEIKFFSQFLWSISTHSIPITTITIMVKMFHQSASPNARRAGPERRAMRNIEHCLKTYFANIFCNDTIILFVRTSPLTRECGANTRNFSYLTSLPHRPIAWSNCNARYTHYIVTTFQQSDIFMTQLEMSMKVEITWKSTTLQRD